MRVRFLLCISFFCFITQANAEGFFNFNSSLGPSFWVNSFLITKPFPRILPLEENPFEQKSLRRAKARPKKNSNLGWLLGYSLLRKEIAEFDASKNVISTVAYGHSVRLGLTWKPISPWSVSLETSLDHAPSQAYLLGGVYFFVGHVFSFADKPPEKLGKRFYESDLRYRDEEASLKERRRMIITESIYSKINTITEIENENKDKSILYPLLNVGLRLNLFKHQNVSFDESINQGSIEASFLYSPDAIFGVGSFLKKYYYTDDTSSFFNQVNALPASNFLGSYYLLSVLQGMPDFKVGVQSHYYIDHLWSLDGRLYFVDYEFQQDGIITFSPGLNRMVDKKWNLRLGVDLQLNLDSIDFFGSVNISKLL